MLREKNLLSIVVPVYNEEACIRVMINRLSKLREKLKEHTSIEFIFVDDGSTDNSYKLLLSLAVNDKDIKLVKFSRNFGHQFALTAGNDYALGEFVATIDADLQDPPEVIAQMYHRALEGYDVVFAKRRNRKGDSLFKKLTAKLFYRFMGYMCETDIPLDTGDFRLMSRRSIDVLNRLREHHRFTRGMVPWLGFKSISITYDRDERYAGETKYPLRKMITFALNAVFSFSTKPISMAIHLGLMATGGGAIGALIMLYIKLFTNIAVPGLTAILIAIAFFSGIQIFLIGVIGEYVARTFEQSKGRPLYIVSDLYNLKE